MEIWEIICVMLFVNMSYGNSGENNIKVSIFSFPQGKLQNLLA